MLTMSIHLLFAYNALVQGVPWTIIQTAIDDLESFLWILVWVKVHTLTDNPKATTHNRGIQAFLKAFAGDLPSQLAKGSVLDFWKDSVLGGLIREWSHIFREARIEVESYADASTEPGWEQEESFESYCKTTYKAVLESGFRHLEGVRKFSTWDDVVDANARR
jgi:hypothetical protein